MPLDIVAVTSVIVDLLLSCLIDVSIIPRIQKHSIRKKLNKAILNAFVETVNGYPSTSHALEDQTFLQLDPVKRELSLLVHPTKKPQIDIIAEAWESYYGKPIQSNLEIFIEAFLKRASKNLWDIDELREVLHQKQATDFIEFTTDKLFAIEREVSFLADPAVRTPDVEEKERDHRERRVDSKVDVCRDLIKSGRPKAALSQLAELESIIQEGSYSNILKFRIVTNIGACNLELGKFPEAISRFKQAFYLQPESPKAKSNLALVHLLENNWEKAVNLSKEVIDSGAEDTGAPSIFVQAVANQRNFDQLDDIIDDRFINDSGYARALGLIFLQAKKFELAEKYLRLCMAQNPSDFNARLLLAQVLIEQYYKKFVHQPFEPPFVSTESKSLLHEALQIVNNALDILKEGDNDRLINNALVARSGIHAVFGNTKDALSDVEAVLKIDSNHMQALLHRGLLAIQVDDFISAAHYFKKLPNEKLVEPSTGFAYVRVLIGNKKLHDANKLLEDIAQTNDLQDNLTYSALKAHILIEQGKKHEANQLKNNILIKKPNDVEALEVASFIEDTQGNLKGAIEHLTSAASLATEIVKERICIRIASIYNRLQKYEEAVAWYSESGTGFLSQPTIAQEYVVSLFYTQRFKEATNIARSIRDSGVIKPVLLEIEAFISELLGDLDAALQLTSHLIDIEPESIRYRINKARIELRNGDMEQANITLDHIEVKRVKDPFDLMFIAQAYILIGKDEKALRTAFRARRIGDSYPEIHLEFIFIFLQVEDTEEELDPIQVDVDTAFLVRTDQKKRWIKVISLAPPDESKWEYQPDHEFSEIFIGKSVGDEVTIKDSKYEEIVYKIEKIQSVHVRLFQETIEDFSERFPFHEGLNRIKVAEGDPTKVLTIIAGQSSHVQSVYELYHSGVFPLELFSNLISRTRIDTIQGLIGVEGNRIFCAIGTLETKEKALNVVDRTSMVTLDVSSLLTLGYLDFLDLLPDFFEKLYVPQAIVDEFSHTIASRELWRKKGQKTIGYSDGRFVIEEVSPELIEKGIKRLEKIQDFVKQACEIVPISLEYAEYLEPRNRKRQVVGPNSIATLIIALQTNSPLLADDFSLRRLAHELFNVEGYWTQPLLLKMNSKGVISHDEYQDAIIKLILANYHYISVNPGTLMRILEKHQYSINSVTNRILRVLEGPTTKEDDAISIITLLLDLVWKSPATNFQKLAILDKALFILVKDRVPEIVLEKLKFLVQEVFRKYPMRLSQITHEINRWYEIMKPHVGLRIYKS